jgi:hypothetical protein
MSRAFTHEKSEVSCKRQGSQRPSRAFQPDCSRHLGCLLRRPLAVATCELREVKRKTPTVLGPSFSGNDHIPIPLDDRIEMDCVEDACLQAEPTISKTIRSILYFLTDRRTHLARRIIFKTLPFDCSSTFSTKRGSRLSSAKTGKKTGTKTGSIIKPSTGFMRPFCPRSNIQVADTASASAN